MKVTPTSYYIHVCDTLYVAVVIVDKDDLVWPTGSGDSRNEHVCEHIYLKLMH